MVACQPRAQRAGRYGGGMAELLHITERACWQEAVGTGEYRVSTRGVTLEQEGFIHCSLRHQLRGFRAARATRISTARCPSALSPRSSASAGMGVAG